MCSRVMFADMVLMDTVWFSNLKRELLKFTNKLDICKHSATPKDQEVYETAKEECLKLLRKFEQNFVEDHRHPQVVEMHSWNTLMDEVFHTHRVFWKFQTSFFVFFAGEIVLEIRKLKLLKTFGEKVLRDLFPYLICCKVPLKT